MDKYYIKDGDVWLGPLSGNEFEVKKTTLNEFTYWKPEFCTNHILHPHLCTHAREWVKPPEVIIEEPVIIPEQKAEPEPTNQKQVILNAEALDPEEETDEAPAEKEKPPKKHARSEYETAGKEPNMVFKLLVIIIGFLLVFFAGMYVNSKLSVMFYQDIIIQESVKNIEYFSRDMVNESKEMKREIDTLNAVAGREFKALRKEIKDVKIDMEKLKKK